LEQEKQRAQSGEVISKIKMDSNSKKKRRVRRSFSKINLIWFHTLVLIHPLLKTKSPQRLQEPQRGGKLQDLPKNGHQSVGMFFVDEVMLVMGLN